MSAAHIVPKLQTKAPLGGPWYDDGDTLDSDGESFGGDCSSDASSGSGAAGEDFAAAKEAWLQARRIEWEEAYKRRHHLKHDGTDRPSSPDAEARKQQWLQERRLEWEHAHRRRSTLELVASDRAAEPDAEALKQQWLQEQRRAHAASMRRRRSNGDMCENDAPLVEPDQVGSTPSEREVYLHSIRGEREASQRERRRQELHAERRPEAGPPLADTPAHLDYALGPFGLSAQPPPAIAGAADEGDVAERAERAERAESAILDELEALEALRMQERRSSNPGSPTRPHSAPQHQRLNLADGVQLQPSSEHLLSPVPVPPSAPRAGGSRAGRQVRLRGSDSESFIISSGIPASRTSVHLPATVPAPVITSSVTCGSPSAARNPPSCGSPPSGEVLRLEEITLIKMR